MKNYLLKIMGTESKLQTKIIKHLEREKWIVVKTIMLSKNGFPDIFAFRNGMAIFIEVKKPNGVRSQIQKYRIEQLTRNGFLAFFCDNLDDFKKIINATK